MAHDHDENTTPEEDARIALEVLASGDIGHALFHAGGALSSDPTNAEYRAILDRILERADDAARLLEGKNDFVNASVRAYALAGKGRLEDALGLVIAVARARPDIAYLVWAREWLAKPGAATSLDAKAIGAAVVGPLLGLLQRLPSPLREQDPARTNLTAALAMLDVVRELHPKMPEAYVATALALRRAGRFADAVKVAESAIAHAPAWQSWVALACARRDAKDIEGACEAFQRASELDAEDTSALLDIGDLRLDQGRADDALRAYDAALARKEGEPWASASAVFLRAQRGDASARELFFEGAAADPQGRAAMLVSRLGDGEYLGKLPGPTDATVQILDTMREDAKKGDAKRWTGTLKMATTSLESPSVRIAFRMQAEVLGLEAKLEVTVGEIQEPDPRETRGGEALFRFEGTDPSPIVAPPSDERARDVVLDLASRSYHRDVWMRVASHAKDVDDSELVALMVHPPSAPKHWPFAALWIQRIQTAAAMILGYASRTRLRAIALGQPDWTTEAAVIALAAHRDEEAKAIFTKLRASIARPGHCPYERALDVCEKW
ncbi:MAG TPA: tetratricopeptide repeat protein [Labilithrix sp.]